MGSIRRPSFAGRAAFLSALAIAFVTSAAGGSSLPVLVSGPSPAPQTCVSPPLPNAETEVALAADPTDAQHLVALWMQDGTEPMGPNSIASATTNDGGLTWSETIVPKDFACYQDLSQPGMPPEVTGAFDPWVSIGPDGTVYGVYLEYGISSLQNPIGGYAVRAVRSLDGGNTWLGPVDINVDRLENGDDKVTITADPKVAGRAYATWGRYNYTFAYYLPYVSRTDDYGVTWSEPQLMFVPLPGTTAALMQLVVLPNGTLVGTFLHTFPQLVAAVQFLSGSPERTLIGPITVESTRSTDGGLTWSTPVTVGSATGLTLPIVALGPDGSLVVTWRQSADARSAIMLGRSVDGGMTWTSSIVPAHPTATSPAVAVAGDGTIGVFLYDHRNDTADGGLTTDAWLARSTDHGISWSESHLGGPFDQNSIPDGALGGFQAIVGLPTGFGAAFTMASPLAVLGVSDIFFASP